MKKILLALLTSATAGWAGSYTNLSSTSGLPAWWRPSENGLSPPTSMSSVGTAVPYEAIPLHVTQTGSYKFLSSTLPAGSWDNYAFLYATNFNAAQPLTGAVLGNDDFDEIVGEAGFRYWLTVEVQYYFVETGYGNGDFGSYRLVVTGPGNILRGKLDNDDDGVPDAWEIAHGTDPNTPDGKADPDGDGFTNRDEYLAGTHPRDAASYLKLALGSAAAGEWELAFLAATNRYHRVLVRGAAHSGAWTTLTNFPPANGPTAVWVRVPVPAVGSARFYKLEAGLGGG